ncbi:MAG: hypothetical protein ACTSXW_08205 [Candidatus Baldrarchaeia archaeon]
MSKHTEFNKLFNYILNSIFLSSKRIVLDRLEGKSIYVRIIRPKGISDVNEVVFSEFFGKIMTTKLTVTCKWNKEEKVLEYDFILDDKVKGIIKILDLPENITANV